jgi:hypothetical protein
MRDEERTSTRCRAAWCSRSCLRVAAGLLHSCAMSLRRATQAFGSVLWLWGRAWLRQNRRVSCCYFRGLEVRCIVHGDDFVLSRAGSR